MLVQTDLTADELAVLAEAAWWACDIPEAIRLQEQLYERRVDADEPVEAASVAIRVCLMWATRGHLPFAMAWQERAARLLRDQPLCRVHGYLAYMQGAVDLDVEEDLVGAESAADELDELARKFRDRNLACFALTLRGMAAVRRGDLAGFGTLDEVMLAVLSGEVEPAWGGDIFCTVIHLCEGLGDLARMRAWTDALNSWAQPLSDTFLFAGVTRVHQLQLLRHEGQWDLVEEELGRRSEDLSEAHGWLAGAGFYELGEVHRLRGRDEEARAAYDRARALNVEPQPGEALLQHAGGDSEAALDGIRVALAGAGSLFRARLLPTAVELALATGDGVLAEQLAREMEATAERFATPGLVAGAARARAAVLMADGDFPAAGPFLERAARIHRMQRQRHDSAQVHEALARVHEARGDDAAAAAAAATARAIYAQLGAAPDLARLTPSGPPGGLTAREAEVLVQVAAGLSNRQVAAALVISEKTVGRHLSSIFLKAGVSSRTAAAAWARDHGLA